MKTRNVLILMMIASAITSSISKADSYIDPLAQTYFVSESDSIGLAKLQRVYSSTTIFRGHFGAGWCSELDARIVFYGAGETRFRSCNLDTAQLIDLRINDAGIERTATGYTRRREDGVIQHFNHAGALDLLIRKDGRIRLQRDSTQRLVKLSLESPKSVDVYKILTEQSGFSDSLQIRSIGSELQFEYQGVTLVRASSTRYEYDDALNMTVRLTHELTENIVYERSTDRVIQISRASSFGAERLLVAIKRDGKSDRTEIRIEVERGAETRPVLILYNRTTRGLSLEGDRDVARLILNWIRT